MRETYLCESSADGINLYCIIFFYCAIQYNAKNTRTHKYKFTYQKACFDEFA